MPLIAALLLACITLACPGAQPAAECDGGVLCGDRCLPAGEPCPADAATAGPAAAGAHASSRGAAAPLSSDSAGTCVLRSITDGDTVRCEDGTRVRFLLVDAPEMDQGEYGRAARQHLATLMRPGDHLRLEHDVQPTDQYGRTLAYVYTPDGVMVNEAMARAGFVVVIVYPPNVKHVERIRAAVDSARAEGAGLWAGRAFECPPVRHRAGGCP